MAPDIRNATHIRYVAGELFLECSVLSRAFEARLVVKNDVKGIRLYYHLPCVSPHTPDPRLVIGRLVRVPDLPSPDKTK